MHVHLCGHVCVNVEARDLSSMALHLFLLIYNFLLNRASKSSCPEYSGEPPFLLLCAGMLGGCCAAWFLRGFLFSHLCSK